MQTDHDAAQRKYTGAICGRAGDGVFVAVLRAGTPTKPKELIFSMRYSIDVTIQSVSGFFSNLTVTSLYFLSPFIVRKKIAEPDSKPLKLLV